jgi:hypothetical protein
MASRADTRRVISALKLDYFLFSAEAPRGRGKLQVVGSVPNYINLDVDIFWLTGLLQTERFPPEIHWVCEDCKRNSYDDRVGDDLYRGCQRLNCVSSERAHYGKGHKCPVSLAIDFPSWVYPSKLDDEGQGSLGTMKLLERYKLKALLLIVGEFEHLERKKDVVFRHSALRPYYVKNGMAESEKKKDGASEKTWNHMEFDFRVTMQKFKEEVKRKRQRLQDSVLGMLMDSAAGKKIIAYDEE